ncbi:hypothetical protein [Streptomyces sp.]|uniref:hypothetical protein n=1 Tax=Streptomyces sp. TaxID=1931 RepID=UPI002F412D7A
MAKNKNQNRQREQHGERRGSATEAQEHAKNAMAEDPVIPAAPQAGRRQQKRFGHN